MIVGVDVGGTFTDLVAVDVGVMLTGKLPTSALQSDAVGEGVRSITGGSTADSLVHGTTVATNALLERKGARTALITDTGFEDIIEIGRQERPSLYDAYADRADPLVEREDRIGWDGVIPPHALLDAEAVAIALVHGHQQAADERRIASEVATTLPDVPLCLSSEVAPEFREFERVSTTVLNAYLMPTTRRYLERLENEVVSPGLAQRLSVMRSSGGLMSIGDASELPAAILLSGPAGGVIASRAVGASLGIDSIVSFDMGGTSTDVCLIEDGVIDVSYERDIAGYTCRLPAVGVHTVGAGGGSIAWIDAGGSLRVGPQSAGANPGPACYGRGGTQPTVTDAHVVLGRIDPHSRLGGSVSVDASAAEASIASIADALSLGLEETALGILRIAEERMAGAVRTVSIDQGADPSGAHLVAFGGAGGLHATAIARSLSMAGVVIPAHAGVFSAVGLLLSPPRADATEAVHVVDADVAVIAGAARRLREATEGELVAAGHSVVETVFRVDVRYLGQAHEIPVEWEPGDPFDAIVARFTGLHERRYGFSRVDDPVEVTAVRAASFGPPPLRRLDPRVGSDGEGRASKRDIVTADGSSLPADIAWRPSLASGTLIRGPAVIEEAEATTFLGVGETARVMPDGSLVVSW